MPLAEGVSLDLTVIWAFVIAFAVLVYVVLDGFDLGLGMLFAVEPEGEDRDIMMNSVAPVWDGNSAEVSEFQVICGAIASTRWSSNFSASRRLPSTTKPTFS